MDKTTRALLDADVDYEQAEDRAALCFKAWLRTHKRVWWMVGNHQQSGTVVGVSHGPYRMLRVKVVSDASGKEYWLNVPRIISLLQAKNS